MVCIVVSILIILYFRNDARFTVNIVDNELGYASLDVGERSFTSIIYWP